jgi:hypothetical protein
MDSTLKDYIISHSQYKDQQIVLPATFWSSRPPVLVSPLLWRLNKGLSDLKPHTLF